MYKQQDRLIITSMSDVPQILVEEPATPERSCLYLGIQSVNVFVRDLERSIKFYSDQLGFRVVWDVVIQSGQRRVGLSPPDGTTVITLIAPEPDSEEFQYIGK